VVYYYVFRLIGPSRSCNSECKAFWWNIKIKSKYIIIIIVVVVIIIIIIIFIIIIIILLAFTTQLRVLASSFLKFRDHTQGRTTVGRTPLDEWSARRRNIYLTNTQHSQ
jgi:hypothetical protein